jgi:hypothetical protein
MAPPSGSQATAVDTVGGRFARGLAAKDSASIRDLLHPEIDLRGLTPNRSWEAVGPDAVLALLLRDWFEDSDEIEAIDHLETDAFSDCERVGYRFRVNRPTGRSLVEQQVYLAARDGRIDWMRIVCSGFRPLSSEE